MGKFFLRLKSKKQDKNCLKILGIGNSFTVDGTEYLWNICKDSPTPHVVVGRISIGGCSLDMHYDNILKNAKNYSFGIWYSLYKWGKKKAAFKYALKKEKWDVIVIQQVSHHAGDPTTYGNLQKVIDYIKKYCPLAKIMWQQTWAYPESSTHGGFLKYNNHQLTMYNAIVDTYKEIIDKNKDVKGIIPSGTAIQNLRTALGDTLNRDGFHLSFDYGRYCAALTWYKAITGESIDSVCWTPASYSYIAESLDVVKLSVNNAIENPFEITNLSE